MKREKKKKNVTVEERTLTLPQQQRWWVVVQGCSVIRCNNNNTNTNNNNNNDNSGGLLSEGARAEVLALAITTHLDLEQVLALARERTQESGHTRQTPLRSPDLPLPLLPSGPSLVAILNTSASPLSASGLGELAPGSSSGGPLSGAAGVAEPLSAAGPVRAPDSSSGPSSSSGSGPSPSPRSDADALALETPNPSSSTSPGPSPGPGPSTILPRDLLDSLPPVGSAGLAPAPLISASSVASAGTSPFLPREETYPRALPATLPNNQPSSLPPVRIGVARDAAFCFYYADNLRLLEENCLQLLYAENLRKYIFNIFFCFFCADNLRLLEEADRGFLEKKNYNSILNPPPPPPPPTPIYYTHTHAPLNPPPPSNPNPTSNPQGETLALSPRSAMQYL
ncbi:hypothetical protein T492DRAFT_839984 [Pavlovales sp. CCMP2436]|nr:hypothetical protein T492DRAFT_839984 [Pavlovales sp. CCMP2436]